MPSAIGENAANITIESNMPLMRLLPGLPAFKESKLKFFNITLVKIKYLLIFCQLQKYFFQRSITFEMFSYFVHSAVEQQLSLINNRYPVTQLFSHFQHMGGEEYRLTAGGMI